MIALLLLTLARLYASKSINEVTKKFKYYHTILIYRLHLFNSNT